MLTPFNIKSFISELKAKDKAEILDALFIKEYVLFKLCTHNAGISYSMTLSNDMDTKETEETDALLYVSDVCDILEQQTQTQTQTTTNNKGR